MKILFLDDDHFRHICFYKELADSREVTWCWTETDAMEALSSQREPFDLAFLDHDLYGMRFVPSGPRTGYEVAQVIASMKVAQRPRKIVIHSRNDDGARAMMDVLPEAIWAKFGEEEFWSHVPKNPHSFER